MPETIVVQNPGMGRWITMRLAERLGVAANIQYPLPAGFVWALIRDHIPDLPERSTFDRSILTWRIMDLLPECLHEPGFEAIDAYLAREPDDLKWYQLSRRLADLFDQYLVYRPDWIQGWEEGREGHWQALLWRLLTSQGDRNHRAGLLQGYLRDVQAGRLRREALPERIFVFGMAALPPIYLSVLEAIGALTEVYLFVLNPCLSYWGDIVDEKTLARLQGAWRDKGRPDVSELYPVGNSLLASLGKLGRDSLELVHEAPCEDQEAFELDLPDSLLGAIQEDMLLLREYGQDEGPGVRALAEHDRSVEVHACHGPMREIEVLYDQLLSLLDAHPDHPDLRPSDIVVMTPDIDACAPYIEAVFGAASGKRRIPWSIADRTPPSEHALVQIFLQLLRLPGSRFEASEIASLLEVPAIRHRAEFDEAGFERVLRWIRESGIRWGLDDEFRKAMDIPDSNQNTWRFGLDRLLLGYAMPVGSPSYRGISPYTEIEGSDGEDLGRLHAFIDGLKNLRQQLARKHTPQVWRQRIGELLALFDPGTNGDDAHAIELVRDAMDAFVEQTHSADFARPIGIEVLRDYLETSLRERTPLHRFLTGGVTFCRMMPLRSIPFRVICLIGMNDRNYPRQERTPGFDLIARDPHPRRGDRSRREDDR
jgi:exodeoxyribonuclease V gamma subunit